MNEIEKLIENAIKEKILSMSLREIISELVEQKSIPKNVFEDMKITLTNGAGEYCGTILKDENEGLNPAPKLNFKDYAEKIKKNIEDGMSIKDIAKSLPSGLALGKGNHNLRHFIRKRLNISVKDMKKSQKDKKSFKNISSKELTPKLNPSQTSLALIDISENMRERLKSHGVHMISDLIMWHPSDLLKIRGIGNSAVDDIQHQLMDFGLTLNYGKYLNGSVQE